MADQIPRAGSGTEIYLFPTVDVPPTRASEQYGIQPGTPEPDPNNRTTDRMGIGGSLQAANGSVLPITVAVQAIATQGSVLGRQIQLALTTNTVRITDIIAGVNRLLNPPAIGVAVPRFSVQFNGDASARTINTDFIDLAAFPPLNPPAGFALVADAARSPAAALTVDDDGTVFCAYLIAASSGPNTGRQKIACARFDQSIDAGWVSTVTDAGMASFIGVVALITPQVTLVNYRHDIYAIVVDAGFAGASGSLYVYRLEANSPSVGAGFFFPISGPITIGTSMGVIANGGITAAALGDRVVLAVGGYSTAGIAFREETRTVWVGQSTDLSVWSDAPGGESGFIALDSFDSVLPPEADGSIVAQQVNRVRFHSDQVHGWAVTDSGRIYASQDGGQTWAKQDCPSSAALYDVWPVTGVDPAITVFACGASGAILRTLDSGATWQIVTIAQSEGTGIDLSNFTDQVDGATGKFAKRVGDQPLRAMAWDTANGKRGWFVGDGKLIFTDNLGNKGSFYDFSPAETSPSFTSVVLLDPAGPTILVGGDIQRNRNMAPKDLKRYRFLRLTHASIDSAHVTIANDGAPQGHADQPGYDYTFHNELTDTGFRPEAIAVRTNAEAYAVGKGGLFLQSTNLTDPIPSWAPGPNAIPTTRDLISIVWRPGVNMGVNEFLILSADGLLLRSVTSGLNWVFQHLASETTGRSVAVLTQHVADANAAVVVCGGGTSIWRTNFGAEFEALPAFAALQSGDLLLATANLQTGQIALRRSLDRGLTFSPVDLSGLASLSFAAQSSGFDQIENATLRPCLFVDEAGQLLLTAGEGGIVSPDGRGDDWVGRNSPQLPLPLGAYSFAEASIQNRSRQTIAFGGGRYLSVTLRSGGTIETRLARQWGLDPTQPFNPIVLGTRQWIGVDDLRVVFDSIRSPIGEKWVIPADYLSPARNLVIDTRTQMWRGLDGSVADVNIDWDRRDDSVVLLKGKGDAWDVTAGALFGSNFRKAFLLVRNFPVGGFPPEPFPEPYLSVPLSADIETTTLAGTPGTDGQYAALRMSGAAWVPSRFRPGVRKYYVEVNHGGVRTAYNILDNTSDVLLVDRDNTSPAAAAGDVCVIFGDRMASIGEGGQVNGAPTPPMIDSPWEFVTWVRLFIPGGQPTADGFKKIETAIIGRHIPVVIAQPEGALPRDRFDAPMQWKPTIPMVEERAASGAVAIQHLGPPVQAWALSYSAQLWADRNASLVPMLAHMRNAWVLIFDDADLLTAELVRLTSDIPAVTAAGADLSGWPLEIEEVR